MQIPITDELRDICRSIEAEQKSDDEWSLEESDDMIQGVTFEGGYDAIERAFCFSFYDEAGDEFWFQITLQEVHEIAAGRDVTVSGRVPD
jgi:hypothetical protein